MLVSEMARRALDIKSLSLPSVVAGLEAEDYTDASGEPALRVWVMLDEATDVDKLTGEMIGDLKSSIQQSLRAHGVTMFPYIFLAKPSERAAAEE
jgi:hypothetical protein